MDIIIPQTNTFIRLTGNINEIKIANTPEHERHVQAGMYVNTQ